MEFTFESYEFNQEDINEAAIELSKNQSIPEGTINSISTYKITWENIFVVETGFNKNIEEKQLESYKVLLRDWLEESYKDYWDIELSKYTNIWASFWDYIKQTAKLTLIIAIVGIALYIAYAFSGSVWWISSFSFAIIAIITLLHDVVISTWLYLFVSSFYSQFQIDTFFITALLTILWYSINDTIVIFDRIRSNLKQFWGKTKNLREIIDISISESLTRSIYTSLTLGFVLVCILIFGPDSISGFTLTMLFGTIIGTFSSIFIASPLLYEMNKKAVLSVYVKTEDKSEEEKMVV